MLNVNEFMEVKALETELRVLQEAAFNAALEYSKRFRFDTTSKDVLDRFEAEFHVEITKLDLFREAHKDEQSETGMGRSRLYRKIQSMLYRANKTVQECFEKYKQYDDELLNMKSPQKHETTHAEYLEKNLNHAIIERDALLESVKEIYGFEFDLEEEKTE